MFSMGCEEIATRLFACNARGGPRSGRGSAGLPERTWRSSTRGALDVPLGRDAAFRTSRDDARGAPVSAAPSSAPGGPRRGVGGEAFARARRRAPSEDPCRPFSPRRRRLTQKPAAHASGFAELKGSTKFCFAEVKVTPGGIGDRARIDGVVRPCFRGEWAAPESRAPALGGSRLHGSRPRRPVKHHGGGALPLGCPSTCLGRRSSRNRSNAFRVTSET